MGMDKGNVMSDIRAEFEAFIILPPHEKEISRFPEDGSSAWPGSYKNLIVDLAWDAWQASRQGVGGDSESIIGFHNALQRVKKIFSEYRQDWPKWGKRLDGTPALNDLPVRIAAAFSELYTQPASADVPEKWRTVMKELADDLESEVENRRSGDLDRRIERDLIVVREARALLAEQEQGHE